MAWERSYYYQVYRCGAKVKRLYCGKGPLAEAAAASAAVRKHDRREARRAEEEKRADLEQAMQPAVEYYAEALRVFRALAVSAGYHQHDRGIWRKRRAKNENA